MTGCGALRDSLGKQALAVEEEEGHVDRPEALRRSGRLGGSAGEGQGSDCICNGVRNTAIPYVCCL